MTNKEVVPKIYTKMGDKGQTSLFSGEKVSKDHLRLEAYGSLDELNSLLGLIQSQVLFVLGASAPADPSGVSTEADLNLSSPSPQLEWAQKLLLQLEDIQNYLFNLGSHLATTSPESKLGLPSFSQKMTQALETNMDLMSVELPPLKSFILPGGSALASHLHMARSLCRRCERAIVRLHQNEPVEEPLLVYINRLSDWLFVCARYANLKLGFKDQIWKK